MRSYLPCLNDTVYVDKGKATRELKDLVVKNATKNHKPLKPLNIGDLYYRRNFNGKKTLRIENLCEMIEVCKNGESYYIKDLTTDRIYLQNRSWIEPSKSSINKIHQQRILKLNVIPQYVTR